MNNNLLQALSHLFSLPNWENRIGDWKDINVAIKNIYSAWLDKTSNIDDTCCYEPIGLKNIHKLPLGEQYGPNN